MKIFVVLLIASFFNYNTPDSTYKDSIVIDSVRVEVIKKGIEIDRKNFEYANKRLELKLKRFITEREERMLYFGWISGNYKEVANYILKTR